MREVTARWSGILAAVLAGSFGLRAMAQEGREEAPKAHRFFESPVDFWQKGIRIAQEAERGGGAEKGRAEGAPASSGVSNDWSFAVKLPDGKTGYQTLPDRLVQVLEDPSPEKVRAYFEWRLERAAKILRAAEAIKTYRQEFRDPVVGEDARSPEPEQPMASDLVRGSSKKEEENPSGSQVRLIYFHRKECPPCEKQNSVLSPWLGLHPEVELQVVEFGEHPKLWAKHRIRGTPTIVVEDGKGGDPVVLEGFSDEKRLDAGLAASRAASRRDLPRSVEKGACP
jgi:hypothetical protein